MDAVIKVGGSLAENPKTLKKLGAELQKIAKKHHIFVVPGGGIFADAVRTIYKKLSLPDAISHKMAIIAMDQYGIVLSQFIPNSLTCYSLAECKEIAKKNQTPIIFPSKILSKDDPFAPSWDVTSDSIAAYIAVKLNTSNAIFVTNVDGVYAEDPRTHPGTRLLKTISIGELLKFRKKTSVDKYLPKFLTGKNLTCYVVNGTCPERIEEILTDHEGTWTKIPPDTTTS
jgi:5-(aminomethyl)-3-furanmethanol phosphate kinase